MLQVLLKCLSLGLGYFPPAHLRSGGSLPSGLVSNLSLKWNHSGTVQSDWRPSLWDLTVSWSPDSPKGRILYVPVLLWRNWFIFVVCRWFLYMVFVFLLGAICTRQSLRYDFMIAEKVTWVFIMVLSGCHLPYRMPELFKSLRNLGMHPSLKFPCCKSQCTIGLNSLAFTSIPCNAKPWHCHPAIALRAKVW